MAVKNANIRVYTKATWAGEWVEQQSLYPLTAVQCVSPERPVAELEFRYGRIKRQRATFYANYAPPNILDQYVKIESTDETTIRWIGVLTDYRDEPHGSDVADPSGRRVFTARGLEHLLDRIPIDHAMMDLDGVAVEVDDVPTHNLRHALLGTIEGNRSTAKVDGTWTFSEDGAKWTVQNILDYLFYNFAPTGPSWDVTGDTASLDSLDAVYDLRGRTLLEAIDALVDRRRGYSWFLDTTGAGTIHVVVFSQFAADVTAGDLVAGTDGNDYKCILDHEAAAGNCPITGGSWATYWMATGGAGAGAAWAAGTLYKKYWTFAANPDLDSIDVDGDISVEECKVDVQRSARYDEVHVVGAPVKACFTVEGDVDLEPGWSAAEQAAYIAAASGSAGYADLSELEQAALNDAYRQSPAFERVYQFYRIRSDWDWLARADAIVNPQVAADGSLVPEVQANYGRLPRPVLDRLPLREGIDYSTPGYPSTVPAGVEPRFRRPLIIVKGPDGRFMVASRPQDPELPSLTFEPAEHETGFFLRGRINHVLALGNWSETPEPTNVQPAYDATTIRATICVATDEVLAVLVTAAGTPPEYGRRLIIQVPDAELWFVAEDTVVGVSNAGALQSIAWTSACLRDDSQRLRIIGALAMAWYGVEHYGFQVTWRNLDIYNDMGYVITSLVASPGKTYTPNCAVTRKVWDFVRQRTTVCGGYWGVDWARVAPVNLPGAQTARSLSITQRNAQARLSSLAQWGGG